MSRREAARKSSKKDWMRAHTSAHKHTSPLFPVYWPFNLSIKANQPVTLSTAATQVLDNLFYPPRVLHTCTHTQNPKITGEPHFLKCADLKMMQKRVKYKNWCMTFLFFFTRLKIAKLLLLVFFNPSQSTSWLITQPLSLHLFVPQLPLPPGDPSSKTSRFQPSLVLNVFAPPFPTSSLFSTERKTSYRGSINHLAGNLRHALTSPLSLSSPLQLSVPYCLSFVSYLPK